MSRGVDSELTLPPLFARPRANVWSLSRPAARKLDQYKQARERDKRNLHDAHSTMRRALKTTIPVEKTAKKFSEALSALEMMRGVSGSLLDVNTLERVKISSVAFSQIIADSRGYRSRLNEIKKAYDGHLDFLLRSVNPDGYVSERTRLESLLDDTRFSESGELAKVQLQVRTLEQQGKELVAENRRLVEELAREVDTSENFFKEQMQQQSSIDEESETVVRGNESYGAKVERLQLEISQLREGIASSLAQRTGSVPLSVCHQLEQCIRASELDLQRDRKQNKELKSRIQEMESKLQRYLQALQIPQEEIVSIWQALQSNASDWIRESHVF